MNSLNGKVIYLFGTGARKVSLLPEMIGEFALEGAEVYTMLSEMGMNLADLSTFDMHGNTILRGYSEKRESIPLEDMVVVAPCTFNTLNKIVSGIADSYPLTLVATAIGARRKVLIAPAMNRELWEHPITQESLLRLRKCGVQLIHPEIIGERVTMAPLGKIADSVFHTLVGTRYDSQRLPEDGEYIAMVERYFSEFRQVGEELLDLELTNGTAGCLSRRVEGGILVTASGSQVGNLSEDDLSLIKCGEGDLIKLKGANNPSSESPLLLELYRDLPESGAIVHGHCPRITYDSKMGKYQTDRYVRYGVFGEVASVTDALKRNDGFAILKLHGEISVDNSLTRSLEKLKSKLEEAHER